MPSSADADPFNDDLLRQAIAGDARALEEVLVPLHDRLRRHIDRQMTPAVQAKLAVDDVLQLTYLQAFKSIGSFRPQGPGAFYGWLKTIASRKLIDASRQRVREKLVAKGGGGSPSVSGAASLTGLLVDSDPGPGGAAMVDELRDAFRVALANLPENYQQVVQLRYLDDLPMEQVASQLGITSGSARGLCHRARQAIRDEMLRLSCYV